MPAQAVGHDKEFEVFIGTKAVFIVVSRTPLVREAVRKYLHAALIFSSND
jgi:hypothetical protein